MKKKSKSEYVKTITTDVLVIGGGGAGLRAAIESAQHKAKTLIIVKEKLGDAHTRMAMGGINVAIKKPATPKQHFDDTINGGWHINNYKMAKIFSEEMPERIYDLESYGVKFDKLPDGTFYTWAGGKQSAPLNLCAGDYTGREMMQGLVKEIKKLKIPYLEDHFVTKLFTNKGSVVGALVLDLQRPQKITIVEAKTTIVATGGGGMLYLINTNAPTNTGEGYAWALDAGAKLVDMEMIQFHPTGIAYPNNKKGRLITEKVRGHGGMLTNTLGKRFMAKYQPKRMELAGRDEVARAIYQEVEEGRGTKNGGVYLDVRHWKKGDVERLIPDVFSDFKEEGIDIRKEMMEVYPSMHHMMGGINITEWGKTSVEGLFAAGEVTRNIHGANRLGGNSIAEGQVFGRRVGLAAAKESKRRKSRPVLESQIKKECGRIYLFLRKKNGSNVHSVHVVLKKLQTLMWHNVGLIRDEKKLKIAEQEIKKIQMGARSVTANSKKDLQMCLDLQEMVVTAQAIILCALKRKESRGAHYRSDYPSMNPAWEKNIEIYKTAAGTLQTKIVPVVKI